MTEKFNKIERMCPYCHTIISGGLKQYREHERNCPKKDLEKYSVIQDFDNKRANAHASLFVASMFGLFTLMSLMDRLVAPKVFSLSNCVVLGLLFVAYVLVGFFGAYSLLNFFFYATTSQHAEVKIIEGKERELVIEYKAKLLLLILFTERTIECNAVKRRQ